MTEGTATYTRVITRRSRGSNFLSTAESFSPQPSPSRAGSALERSLTRDAAGYLARSHPCPSPSPNPLTSPPTPPPSPSPLTYRSLGRNLARRRLRPRQEPCSGGTWCRSPTRGILLELSTVTVCPLCGACRSDPKHHGVRYIALWHRRSSEVLSEREPECECSRRHAVSLTRTICLLSVEPAAQVQSIMVLDISSLASSVVRSFI